AGGLRIAEPAADFVGGAALFSALTETPGPPGAVVFCEIALSGEGRPVGHTQTRRKKGAKAGFTEGRSAIPRGKQREAGTAAGFRTVPIEHLRELVERLASKRSLGTMPRRRGFGAAS